MGGTASIAPLSDEDNQLVYEVVVGTKQVKIDATTGKVLEVDVNDSEEGGEKAERE